MNKHTVTISHGLLGELSKAFVIERLGLEPKQHQLTANGAWIQLADRLLHTPAIEKRNTRQARRQKATR